MYSVNVQQTISRINLHSRRVLGHEIPVQMHLGLTKVLFHFCRLTKSKYSYNLCMYCFGGKGSLHIINSICNLSPPIGLAWIGQCTWYGCTIVSDVFTPECRLSVMDHWTGLLDWATGLTILLRNYDADIAFEPWHQPSCGSSEPLWLTLLEHGNVCLWHFITCSVNGTCIAYRDN